MLKRLFVLVASSFLLAGCSLADFVQKKAGLQVSVADGQAASVFVDGINVGQTPFSGEDIEKGQRKVRLVPDDSSKEAYETTVTLSSGSVTAINWNFGATAEESSGEILELSKISSKKKAEFSVVTNPDNIFVKIDGQSKGFSPLLLEDLSEGPHQLTLTAPGYVERTSTAKLVAGYRLTVTAKLGREPLITQQLPQPSPSPSSLTASPSPTPKATPKPSSTPAASSSATTVTPPKPYVEIAETGTGWLRVRAEASGSSAEVAKLDVGSKVPYSNETVNGWHKVEYATGKQGWVSGQYATVVK
jgi:hypothetical protein